MKIRYLSIISSLIMVCVSCSSNEKRQSNKEYFSIIQMEEGTYLPSEIKYETIDTLELISELLKMEGDIRIHSMEIMCHDPRSSQIYTGDLKKYSIQVWALFYINRIVFDDANSYSPYEILVNNNSKFESSVDGEIIKEAYECYNMWFETVKEKGLEKIKKEKIYPLNNCTISWYR